MFLNDCICVGVSHVFPILLLYSENYRMKKFLLSAVVLLVIGYVVYQNGSLWLLKLLSLTSGTAPGSSSSTSLTGSTPPYKNGTYTGSVADAFYGNIQVQAVILGGKISDVHFLQYPSDRTRSIAINTLAMPNLRQEAIQAQTANVNIVSGATDSSNAFSQSLSSALSQAK